MWTANKTDTKDSLRRKMLDIDLSGATPDDAHRRLKVVEDKLINPPRVRQAVLTLLWTEFERSAALKRFVLDQQLWGINGN